MNPLRIFDQIYCRFVIANDIIGYDLAKEENGILLLSFFQTLNIQTIILNFHSNGYFTNKYSIIKFFGLIILLFALNYYRYKKVTNFKNLSRRWSNDSRKVRSAKNIGFILYCIMSIVFLILISEFKRSL